MNAIKNIQWKNIQAVAGRRSKMKSLAWLVERGWLNVESVEERVWIAGRHQDGVSAA